MEYKIKKILIFSNEFMPDIGGAGIVAYEIATALSKLGYLVTVLTNKNKRRELQMNFKIIEIRTFPKIFPLNYLFYFKKLNFDIFDTIVINGSGAALTASCFFDDVILKKSILFLHGSEPEEIFQHPKFLFKVINFKKKYLTLLQKVKKILSVSNFMKGKFLQKTKLYQFENKIFTWHVGVNNEIFYRDPVDLHSQLGLKRDKILLLSVGRINKMKGYLEKYNIFKNLIKKRLLLHWIIIGDGDYLPILKKMIFKDGLQENISLMGKIDHCNLRKYYSSVDLFWLLSKYEEAFPLVYLEASACGTPVIARNNAGARESVKHGVTGFLIDSEEKVESILKNKTFERITKKDISSFMEDFFIQHTIKKFVKLIEL